MSHGVWASHQITYISNEQIINPERNIYFLMCQAGQVVTYFAGIVVTRYTTSLVIARGVIYMYVVDYAVFEIFRCTKLTTNVVYIDNF